MPDPGARTGLAAVSRRSAGTCVTWWFGLPSSSSHALIGALAGAGLAAGVRVDWGHDAGQGGCCRCWPRRWSGSCSPGCSRVVVVRAFRPARYIAAVRGFRLAQTVSASAMALGHGLQDGQKSMGAIVLGAGRRRRAPAGRGVPIWVRLRGGGAGSGHRGGRLADHQDAGPPGGADRSGDRVRRRVRGRRRALRRGRESSAVPVSTTHTVTAAIMGAGATRRAARRSAG